ncbi:MAG: UDP-N-acetylglucosamine 4,6-dehydratase (inverting) [Verrucomicrobia bacterium]|nr:UDP-N-acetylglucosamine 4,6-dehydratase (inverting) [Verrucomicrobiota bacterium]
MQTPRDPDEIFRDKTVLITGGTGSFGKAMATRLLSKNLCSKVIIFSRDEWKQWQMQKSHPLFNHPKIRYFLGDVRDKDRLARAFHEVQYVIHAAALKQVPAAEYNPSEFVKTNVQGAMNIIDAAVDARVEKVIALSTDKAVNPVNLYGATKLCSDKLFVAGNSYVGKSGTPAFSVVRYGNVLGSRGSILPYWQELLKEGATALPITDVRMTRFWLTLEQAVEFVCSSAGRLLGGEIFIPKAASVRIVDLANVFAPGVPHTLVGIRPGEKIHEVLLSQDDSRQAFEYDTGYVVTPFTQGKAHHYYTSTAKHVPEGFLLSSDTNPLFLSSLAEIRKLIENIQFEPTT